MIQIFSHNIIIQGGYFRLILTVNRSSGNTFGQTGFRLLIFQLLITHQRAHKVSREEFIIQQNGLRKVIYRTGKILNQIEIKSAQKTFLGILIIGYDIRSMGIDQSKMEFHLFFRQRSFHISNTQRFREQFLMIQLLNIFMEMNNALHLTRFLIICQCIHRFHLNGYVPVLNTTAVVALIFLVFFRIISNHDFPVILHILIGFLTRFARILIILIIVCNVLIACRNPVTLVYLHLHDFEFILFGTFTITDLLTSFGTLIVSGHKIRIFVNHLRIVTDSTTIITRLCTEQTTVESCHHIIRFYL